MQRSLFLPRVSMNSVGSISEHQEQPQTKRVKIQEAVITLETSKEVSTTTTPTASQQKQQQHHTPSVPPSSVVLQKQQMALEYIKQGKHVFLTGPAGCGKSYTIHLIVKYMQQKYGKIVAVTATTGCAALLIGGSTLHSTLGIGLARKSASDMASSLSPSKRRFINSIDLLVIDEISMLSADLFEKINDFLNCVCDLKHRSFHSSSSSMLAIDDYDKDPHNGSFITSRSRSNSGIKNQQGRDGHKTSRFFGGIQLLLSGDFCQLPPVQGEYTFTSDIWSQCQMKTVLFTEPIRQSSDPIFQEILQRARMGNITIADIKLLRAHCSMQTSNPSNPCNEKACGDIQINATRLYSHNVDVDRVNAEHYAQLLLSNESALASKPLMTRERVYPSMIPPEAMPWAKSINVPDSITLAPGTQVILIRTMNLLDGLVNGSRGVVTSVEDSQGPWVLFKSVTQQQQQQKKQQQDSQMLDVSKDSSSMQSNDTLSSLNVSASLSQSNMTLTTSTTKRPLLGSSSSSSLPSSLIEIENIPIQVLPVRTESEFHPEKNYASFVPLRLGYAITCHKSQGMTLDSVEMDLGPTVFAPGQAYTALSRARNRESIRLIQIVKSAFKADPTVCAFYDSLNPTTNHLVLQK